MDKETNNHFTLKNNVISLEVDSLSGAWLGLYGGRSSRSWLRSGGEGRAGLPFVGASAIHEGHNVAMNYQQSGPAGLLGTSARGGVTTSLALCDTHLSFICHLPDRRGPRSGVCVDLDHMDLEGGSPQ